MMEQYLSKLSAGDQVAYRSYIVAYVRPAVPALATPAFVDLDGDGDADFVTGGLSGGLLYYERR